MPKKHVSCATQPGGSLVPAEQFLCDRVAFESLVKETLRKGIVKLSPRTFQAFVDTGPRNYTRTSGLCWLQIGVRGSWCDNTARFFVGWELTTVFIRFVACRCVLVVIELTSLGGSFHCPNCRSSHDEFGLAAASYLSSIGGDLHSAAFLKQPVFFVYMDYSEAMIEYFRKVTTDKSNKLRHVPHGHQFHLQNVPHFAVVPSTLKESFEPQSESRFFLSFFFFFYIYHPTINPGKYESGSVKTAEDLAKLVKKAAKVHFSVSRPVWPSLLFVFDVVLMRASSQ